MTARAFALLEVTPREWVLDLACGMGQDTRALAAAQGRAASPGLGAGLTMGLEPSERMIRWGQVEQRCAPGGGRVGWARAFGETLPLREAVLDAILCKGALDHFEVPQSALAEAARVLKPGGRIVIALSN